MTRTFDRLKALLRNPRARELFAWCLPALLLGLALRVALTVQMPYAFFHDDAADFLATPDRLLHQGKLSLHGKKTFLVPGLMTVPFLIGVPAMIAIPAAQHLLGLGLVGLVGWLCRLWLNHWKWFILPLTVLTAVNPFMLWYEHTIMAETVFVFCTALVALAGTLYTLEHTRARFVLLCFALVLEAGARPEGKLLFGFGILLLVMLHFRAWRAYWVRMAALLALALTVHYQTKTSQAGLLLYTSVARFTPENLAVAPGFDQYIAPIREDLQRRWVERVSFPRVQDRRAVADAVGRYLRERTNSESSSHREVNEFCLKLAVATCRQNFFHLPIHAFRKFRYVAVEAPAGRLDRYWLFDRQREAYLDSSGVVLRLSRRLFGQELASVADLNRFVDTQYREISWFNALVDRWLAAINTHRFPDVHFDASADATLPLIYFGVPFYFLLGALGLLAAALRRGALQPLHLAWGVTLIGFFFVIMLTANVRPRFRFVFEPFWFLYLALLAESLWLAAARLFRRG